MQNPASIMDNAAAGADNGVGVAAAGKPLSGQPEVRVFAVR